jgi:hypothetical protein
VNGEFVAKMEDVLDLYEAPYNPKRPLICMDESPKQLLKDTRESTRGEPHCPSKQDREYERNIA